jgi:hypothetical protein
MVYLALDVIGFWVDKSLRTLIALVSLSPEAPEKLNQNSKNFRIHLRFYSIFLIYIKENKLKN